MLYSFKFWFGLLKKGEIVAYRWYLALIDLALLFYCTLAATRKVPLSFPLALKELELEGAGLVTQCQSWLIFLTSRPKDTWEKLGETSRLNSVTMTEKLQWAMDSAVKYLCKHFCSLSFYFSSLWSFSLYPPSLPLSPFLFVPLFQV